MIPAYVNPYEKWPVFLLTQLMWWSCILHSACCFSFLRSQRRSFTLKLVFYRPQKPSTLPILLTGYILFDYRHSWHFSGYLSIFLSFANHFSSFAVIFRTIFVRCYSWRLTSSCRPTPCLFYLFLSTCEFLLFSFLSSVRYIYLITNSLHPVHSISAFPK